MRNLFYCIVGVILISCSFNKENEYVTYDLNLGIFGNLYEISVPKNLANSNYKSGPGFSAWMNENDALFLRVYFKNDSVKEKMRVMVSEKKNKYASNGFYAIEESVTDSTNSITFCYKEMQKLHSHTIIKEVELGYFVVELEGLNGCTYEDAQKIVSSIKLRIKKSEVAETYTADINESKCARYKLNAQKSAQINTSTVILDKTFGNKYFSLNYPSDWEIINEDANTIDDIKISIHVMQKRINDIDFLPNVNIIKSKHIESTQEIAHITLNQMKQFFLQVKEGVFIDIVISGCKGTCLTYNCNVQGYELEFYQYFIKKADNTTYTITCAIDYFKRDSQKTIVDAIVKSLVIK